MKKSFSILMALSFGVLSANAALANDAVLGAIVGGGVGAVVGNHVSGRDGAIIGGAVGAAAGAVIASDNEPHHRRPVYGYAPQPPVRVYAPAPAYAPVYAPAPVYSPAPVYYAPPPVRVVDAPVVYVPAHPAPRHWREDHHRRHHDWR